MSEFQQIPLKQAHVATARSGDPPVCLIDTDNYRDYVSKRASSATISPLPDSSINGAVRHVQESMEAEVAALLANPKVKPVVASNVRAAIDRAAQVYYLELEKAGITSRPNLAVVHDERLPKGMNSAFGRARVVRLNKEMEDITVPVIAHEFGHAGATLFFKANASQSLFYGAGMTRCPTNERTSCHMLDELASMALFLAALGENPRMVSQGVLLPLDQLGNDQGREIARLAFRLFDPDGVKKATSESRKGDWLDTYLAKKSRDGEKDFRVPVESYDFGEQENGSHYRTATRYMDLVSEELFPNLPHEEAHQKLRSALICAQAEGDNAPVLFSFEKAFGSPSLNFFSSLRGYDKDTQRGQASCLLLGLFVEARRLPSDECAEIRAKLFSIVERIYGTDETLIGEYERRRTMRTGAAWPKSSD